MTIITYSKQNNDLKLVGKSCKYCTNPVKENETIAVHRNNYHQEFYHPIHLECLNHASGIISRSAKCITCNQPYSGYHFNPSKIKTDVKQVIKPKLQ